MAGRVDRRDGAGARQLVFLLPGKHTRPGAASQDRLSGRRGGPCGSHLPGGARTRPARPWVPAARLDSLPEHTVPLILVTRYSQLWFSKLKAGSADTDRA